MRSFARLVFFASLLGCLPTIAFAQASLAGVARDTSGAVLPGVTVEAASPALIERVRTAVTDNSGQYRIENLRPGTYSVTFTLQGFAIVKREGVELSGSATATVNADMRVGGLEETVTVTGESPIVDVQNTMKERVITHEVIDAIPTGRSDRNLAMLVPAVTVSGNSINQDVGGTADQQNATMSVHGSRGGDQRITYNGVSVGVAANGANTLMAPNMSAYQEVAIDTGAVSAELGQGGVRVNFIPKDGGNRFSGTAFYSFTNTNLQGNNYTDTLKAAGLATPDALKSLSDFNPGFGGPIMKDRLWFYAAYKRLNNETYPAGAARNLNANNPNVWTYAPDPASRPFNTLKNTDYQVRVTWQAMRKLKVAFTDEHGDYCGCSADITALLAPEAALWRTTPTQHNLMGDWTMPLTNRLLISGAFVHRIQDQRRDVPPGTNPLMIPVIEQALGNLIYRNVDPTTAASPQLRVSRFMTGNTATSVSYITGSHAFKGGFIWGINDEKHQLGNVQPGAQQVTYRFNNGVPNQITLYAYPLRSNFHTNSDSGIFAQDKWTIARVTLSYGVRYERYVTSFPDQTAGPTQLTPGRNVFYPSSKGVAWNDLTPKSGVSWDLFGDGRTAVKASLNKYVLGEGPNGIGGTALSPINRTTNVTTRSWSDANRDYSPDCNLTIPAANGECGPMVNQSFGSTTTSTAYDQSILSGWGIRTFDWEFSTGVQRQISRGTSVDVTYFRRWYGNFFATDNRAVGPANFSPFSVTAPSGDSRLPGAGETIGGYYDLNPDKVGQVDNFITRAKNFGTQTEHWNGVDFSVSARPREGFFVQGGTSTGRTSTSSCDIRAKLPESALTNPFCTVTTPWLTSLKLQTSYILPRVDVQVSGTMQSIPGPPLGANYVVTTAQVAPSLGRPLSGNAANATVPLVPANSLYVGRVNQVDMRVSKRVALMGTSRAALNFDVYNLLNANATLGVNSTFNPANPTIWQRPTSVMQARLFKFSVQLDF
jgi:hypothetical protein